MPIWVTQPDDGSWRAVDTVKFFTWLVSLTYCACLWMFGLAALIFGNWAVLEVLAAAACVTALSALIAAFANAVAEFVLNRINSESP